MLLAVLSGFVLAILAPWLYKTFQDKTGWVLALLPASLFVYFATYVPTIMGGEVVEIPYQWVPSLDIELTMYVDGLSLLFALLISFIGTFILIYGGGYLHGDRAIARFYVFLLGFMASMLGLVLSDSLMAMFVFWELTSITSFMLIGYYHENAKYRKCAHQSMMVTVGGGLAMMAGLIMLAMIAGTYSITEILALAANDPTAITDHDLYLTALILILAGCFTKSAQVPFHFWLPNAMAGPTPVSAFLHSATMVKAGIYLMARLHPAMGGTEVWQTVLPVVGAITMFTGMYMALRSGGYKQVLAYSTIMALGVLTMLVGIGTEEAMLAFVVFLLAHALYKATLFMVAGIVDHETGTKDLTVLRGLRKKMPVTFGAAILAALSLAGVPLLFGFIGKELMFEAVLEAEYLSLFLTILALGTAMMGFAVGLILGLKPFWGELGDTPKDPHEAPISMLLGPVVLASLSLLTFVFLTVVDDVFVQAAVPAVYGPEMGDFYLTWWHGINLPLIMSGASIIVGLLIFWKWDTVRAQMNRLEWLYARGPESVYNLAMNRGLPLLANRQTRFLQNGYLRNYLTTILLTMVVLVGYTFFTYYDQPLSIAFDVEFYHVLIAGVLLSAAVVATSTKSRLGAVASAGVVGFSVAVIYVLFSAPDLAITQMLVETLTVILLVLVLFRLPEFVHFSSPSARMRDLLVGILVGALVTVLLLAVGQQEVVEQSISAGHLEGSYPLAHGRNVVNVILVDYRTLDTLGEIFVLALAAMGVYAMVKFRANDDEELS